VTLQSGFQFGNNQKSHREKSGEHDGLSDYNINFLARNSQTKACHKRINCHDSRCKQQAEVQVFSDEQHPATIPVFPSKNAGSCFDPIQETQNKQMPL